MRPSRGVRGRSAREAGPDRDRTLTRVSGTLVDALLLLAFILLGGFFAAAEIALVSLRESQVRALRDRGRRGERLAKLAADPNRFLAAVQVGVTLAGFLSAAFGAATLGRAAVRPAGRLGRAGRARRHPRARRLTLLISYFSLVLGELAPKRLALQRAEALALLAAAPLDRIATLSGRSSGCCPRRPTWSSGCSAATRRPTGRRSPRRSCATWSPRTSR